MVMLVPFGSFRRELVFRDSPHLSTVSLSRPANLQRAVNHMNDYHYIRVAKTGYENLTWTQTAQIHMDHRRWLEERLLEEFESETTVITHHAPHLKALKGPPSSDHVTSQISKR